MPFKHFIFMKMKSNGINLVVGQRLCAYLDKLHVLILVCYIKMVHLAKNFLLKERCQCEADL